MAKLAAKKPAAKPALKGGTKPAAKAAKPAAKGAAAKKPAPKKDADKALQVGDHVVFSGYPEGDEREPVFEVGTEVVIVDVGSDAERGTFYTCVTPDNVDAFNKGDDVDGDELLPTEVKRKAKGAVPAVVKDPMEQYRITFKTDAKLTKMLKGADAVEVVNKLYAAAQENFYYIGGALAGMWKDAEFRKLGDYEDKADDKGKVVPGEGWNRFCADKFDGISGRTARSLIQMYTAFSVLDGFDVTKLNSIGWSKAVELSRYVTADNADELVQKAAATPIRELREVLKVEYVSDDGTSASGKQASRGGPKVKKTTFGFQLPEDKGDGVRQILDLAQKQLGLGWEDTFEHIVREWGNDHLQAKPKAKVATAVAGKPKTKVAA